MIKVLITILMFSQYIFARESGQTEITADEGIEVFQNEKYYLLKENVKITSDDFDLSGDEVKAYFEKDLYDITILDARNNVTFKFKNGAEGKGDYLNFLILEKKLTVSGKNSYIQMNNLEMKSDKTLIVDDGKREFFLNGRNSKLKTENLEIIAETIEGKYDIINKKNEITNLILIDKKLVSILDKSLDMYAQKAIYSKKNNLIELFDNVKIIRNNETAIGDYAKINTVDNSYKITSKDSKGVKLIIENNE